MTMRANRGALAFWARQDAARRLREGDAEPSDPGGPCDHGVPEGQSCGKCQVWDHDGSEAPWGETGSAF